MMACALAACVERAAGRDGRKYVDVILKHWGDGSVISNSKGSQFGFTRWRTIGSTTTSRPSRGSSTATRWGRGSSGIRTRRRSSSRTATGSTTRPGGRPPQHHAQPGRAHAEALHRAHDPGRRDEARAEAKSFLDSWHKRVPAECIPGVRSAWAASGRSRTATAAMGPVTVIPWAFHAWRTGTASIC
jgi:hypothetical protein